MPSNPDLTGEVPDPIPGYPNLRVGKLSGWDPAIHKSRKRPMQFTATGRAQLPAERQSDIDNFAGSESVLAPLRAWAEVMTRTHTDKMRCYDRDVLLALILFIGWDPRRVGADDDYLQGYPTHSMIAEKAGCSVRTVGRVLAKLGGRNILSWTYEGWPDRRGRRRCRYQLLPGGPVITGQVSRSTGQVTNEDPVLPDRLPTADCSTGQVSRSKGQVSRSTGHLTNGGDVLPDRLPTGDDDRSTGHLTNGDGGVLPDRLPTATRARDNDFKSVSEVELEAQRKRPASRPQSSVDRQIAGPSRSRPPSLNERSDKLGPVPAVSGMAKRLQGFVHQVRVWFTLAWVREGVPGPIVWKDKERWLDETLRRSPERVYWQLHALRERLPEGTQLFRGAIVNRVRSELERQEEEMMSPDELADQRRSMRMFHEAVDSLATDTEAPYTETSGALSMDVVPERPPPGALQSSVPSLMSADEASVRDMMARLGCSREDVLRALDIQKRRAANASRARGV